MSFYKFFSVFDMFRIPFFFQFNHETRISSKFGIFCSICITIFLLYNFIRSDLLLKSNPFIVSQTTTLSHAPRIKFTQDTLITLNVGDDNSNKLYDPSIFSIGFFAEHLKPDENGVKVLIEEVLGMHLCTEQDMPNNSSDVFKTLNLNNSLCLDDKNLLLEGQFDENFLDYFIIELYMCDNATFNNSCKSQDIINDYLSQSKYFGIIWHDIFLDLNDYADPMKNKFNLLYGLIDPTLLKRYNIYLKKSQIITDNGVFTNNFDIKEDFTFDYKDFDFSTKRSNDQPVFQLIFYSSKNIDKTSRRYQKLQDLLGSLSGTANFFILICSIIVNMGTKIKIVVEVLNSLYIIHQENKFSKSSTNEPKKKIPKLCQKDKEVQANKLTLKDIELKLDENDKKTKNSIHKSEELQQKNKILVVDQCHNKIENVNHINSLQHKPVPSIYIQSKILESLDQISSEHASKQNFQIPEINKGHNALNVQFKKTISFDIKSTDQKKLGESQPILKKIANLFQFKEKSKNQEKCNNLKICLFDYIMTYFYEFFNLKKSAKYKLISKALNSYKEEVDLIRILSKIQELEKMKIILFNNDQLVLFHSLSKPLLNIEDNENCDDLRMSSSLYLTKGMESCKKTTNLKIFMESYQKVRKSSEENLINKRLILMVDENLIEFQKKISGFS